MTPQLQQISWDITFNNYNSLTYIVSNLSNDIYVK